MECKDSIQWISDWLDGALTPVEERMLMMHLEQCPRCAALWEELTALHTACSDLPEIAAPEGFTQSVMAQVRETGQIASLPQKQKKTVPLFSKAANRWLAAAACVVVGIGLGRVNLSDGAAQSPAAENAVVAVAEECAPMEMERTMAALQAEATQNDTVEMEYGWVADRAEVEAAVPVLVLERLPEGSEAVLGKEVFWSEQENGEKSCFVTAEQGEQLLMLAREQNLHIRENGAWNPTHTVWEICVTAE